MQVQRLLSEVWIPENIPLAVIGNKKRRGGVILAATPVMKEKFNIGTANRVQQIPDDSEIILVETRMGIMSAKIKRGVKDDY